MVKTIARRVAIALLLLNAIGAIFGGAMLTYDPSGKAIQMPLEILEKSPFSNFLIPEIILFIFNGVLSLVAAIVTIRKRKHSPYFIIFQGFVLGIWLTVQIAMIRDFYAPLHLTYYILAALLLAAGFYLLKKKPD